MKTIVLAGGFAKRLWPLTLDMPKALIEVGGRPVVDYTLEQLEKVPEVTEIIISTNAKFESQFNDWLATRGSAKPVRIVSEPARSEEEKLGAIGGIAHVVRACDIKEDCLIVAGDNMLDFEMADFIRFYERRNAVINAIFDVQSREEARRMGIVKLDGDRIVGFVEKPADPPSTLASTGCYLFPRETLPLFQQYLNEGNNKDAPGFFLQWLHTRVPVHAFLFNSTWFDVGTQSSLAAARKFME